MVSWHRVIILCPTHIIYRNSEIGNSDSDFLTRNHKFFSDDFPTEFHGISESEAEIPISDPPARGAIPAENTTKLSSCQLQWIGGCFFATGGFPKGAA